MSATPTPTPFPPTHPRGGLGRPMPEDRAPSVCTESEFRLEEWLGEIGVTPSKIAVTARQLRDNDLDDRMLLQKITAEELKECGVASVGIRKCIIEAVRSPTAEDTSLSGFKSPRSCLSPSPSWRRHVPSSIPMSPPDMCSTPLNLTTSPLVSSAAVDVHFLEYQVLTCCGSKDFELTRCVAAGQNGIVFAARCLRKGMPKPNKLFALKLVFNFGLSTAATRNTFENEFNVLSRLPPHNNITRFWTQFVDEIPDVALDHLPKFARDQATYRTASGNIQRRKAQFIVLDYHPETFRHHRSLLPVPLPYGACLRFALDLIRAAVHLQAHQTVHLDLKPDNILVALDGRIVLCDFGTAVQFESEDMCVAFSAGMCVGGNLMHLAPEVLNEHERLRRAGPGAKGFLCYRQQEVWAVGVLIHSMIFASHPWPDYPNDCGGVGNIHYNLKRLAPYPVDYPDGFRDTVMRMLALDPAERISIEDALLCFESLPLPPQVDLDEDTSVLGRDGSITTHPVSITTRYVNGASTTLVVDAASTVSALLQRSLSVFFPSSDSTSLLKEHHAVYAGRLLPPAATIGVLGLDVESCIHIVHKTSNRGVDQAPMSPGLSVAGAYDSSSASQSAGWRLDRAEDAPLAPPVPLDGSPCGGGGGPSVPPSLPVALVPSGGGSSSGGPAGREWGGQGTADTTLIPFKPLGVPADVLFENDNATAETSGKWVTVMADCPGVSSGRLEWELKLEEAKPGAGLAIGVADMSLFFPTMQNLGVGEGSWCYSKTGQASIGGAAGFSDYGETFTHGCTVGVVLDMDAGTLRFTKDGVDQGIACCTGIRGRVLSPGVVMGTNKGGKRTRVTIIRSACFPSPTFSLPTRIPLSIISHFNSRTTASPAIVLSNSLRTATTSGLWGSLLVNPGEVEADVTVLTIVVDEAKPGAGLGIGLADVEVFDFKRHILGVSPGSWCYSKTGQASAGDGFRDYGDKYTTGDRISMVLNRVEGTVRFYRDDADQGVAFRESFVGRRLVPALVMGSSSGGKVTKVTILSTTASVPPSVHSIRAAPRLFV